ncbi:MAG: RNA polymerase sigma factor RpoD/SigA [Gemmatimonadetes bacterium]|jgi:RNA polymerase primary sigma factor|nr:RNA polymerase sigma factor RpoD/SigA [Gemmatimonadota bacterium]MBT7863862.1 RNA polymerase sigma factor RpoD/SigA [Gemmatimonadota bacterium]
MARANGPPVSGEPRVTEGDKLLSSYLQDIADSTPLSSAQEAELARRIRQGDEGARNLLVEANLRFVVAVSKQYQGRGLTLAELISAGNVGLITAAERFDEKRGFKFISYAVWWIRQGIMQSLTQQSTVRVPLNRVDMLSKVSRTLAQLQQDGEPPSIDRVAEKLGCGVKEVEQALAVSNAVRSLDAPFEGAEGDGQFSLLDCLCDEKQTSAEDDVLTFSRCSDVKEALAKLPPREAQVLRLYYGLDQDQSMTLDEIGRQFRLTRERVRQIKELALGKLRHPRFHRRLRVYAEN